MPTVFDLLVSFHAYFIFINYFAFYYCSRYYSTSKLSKSIINTFCIQATDLSILLSATMNGVFLVLSRLMDSKVCSSRPCMMSTTRMAMSHREDPRDLRLLKEAWPGVSIINRPGNLSCTSANCT